MQLDPGFGSAGLAVKPVDRGGDLHDELRAVAVQSDGKIVGAGSIRFGTTDTDFVVARWLANGQLDTTFGAQGVRTISFDIGGGNVDEANAVLVLPDGKIVVAGTAEGSEGRSEFAVARLTASGELDQSFNQSGKKRFTLGGAVRSGAYALAREAGGTVLVVGDVSSTAGTTVGLARLKASGDFDPSLSISGQLQVGGLQNGHGRAVVVQPDGKILIGGSADQASRLSDFLLVRLTAAGSLDGGFGQGGKVLVGSANFEGVTGLALQPDGKIVTLGYDFDDFVFRRFASNGSVDAGFGDQGVRVVDIGGDTGDDAPSSVLVLPDGTILGGGTSRIGSGRGASFARLRSDGTPDTSFAPGGKAVLALGSRSGEILALASAGGSIVGAGLIGNTIQSADTDLLVIRVTATPATPDPAAVAPPSAPDLRDTSDTGISRTDNVTPESRPTFSVSTASSGLIVQLLRDGVVVATRSGPGTLTDPSAGQGTFTYTTRHANAEGAAGPRGGALTVVIDRSAPGGPGMGLLASDDTGIVGDGFTRKGQPRVTGLTVPGARVEILDGSNKVVATTTANSGGRYTVALRIRDGAYSFRARATDPAGNIGATGRAFALTINTRPAPAVPNNTTGYTRKVGTELDRARKTVSDASRRRADALGKAVKAKSQKRVNVIQQGINDLRSSLTRLGNQELVSYDVTTPVNLSFNFATGSLFADLELPAGARLNTENFKQFLQGKYSLPQFDVMQLAAAAYGLTLRITGEYDRTRTEALAASRPGDVYFASERFVKWANPQTVARLAGLTVGGLGDSALAEAQQIFMLEYNDIVAWLKNRGARELQSQAGAIFGALVSRALGRGGEDLQLPSLSFRFVTVPYQFALERSGVSQLAASSLRKIVPQSANALDAAFEPGRYNHLGFAITWTGSTSPSVEQTLQQFDASKFGLSGAATGDFNVIRQIAAESIDDPFVGQVLNALDYGSFARQSADAAIRDRLSSLLGLDQATLLQAFSQGNPTIDLKSTPVAGRLATELQKLTFGNEKSTEVTKFNFDVGSSTLNITMTLRHRHSWGSLNDVLGAIANWGKKIGGAILNETAKLAAALGREVDQLRKQLDRQTKALKAEYDKRTRELNRIAAQAQDEIRRGVQAAKQKLAQAKQAIADAATKYTAGVAQAGQTVVTGVTNAGNTARNEVKKRFGI